MSNINEYSNPYFKLFFDKNSVFYGDLGIYLLAKDQEKTEKVKNGVKEINQIQEQIVDENLSI